MRIILTILFVSATIFGSAPAFACGGHHGQKAETSTSKQTAAHAKGKKDDDDKTCGDPDCTCHHHGKKKADDKSSDSEGEA